MVMRWGIGLQAEAQRDRCDSTTAHRMSQGSLTYRSESLTCSCAGGEGLPVDSPWVS